MKKIISIGWICLLITYVAQAQQTDTLAKKLDSLQANKDSIGKKPNINRTAYNENTKINVPVYFTLLGTDFTQEVTGPFHSSTKTWQKVAGFVVLEGGMFLLDKKAQHFASQLMVRNPGFKGLSHYVTNFGAAYEGYTLAAFGIYGWAFKNQKMKTTTLLATQSYIVAGVMEALIKFVSGRQRPNYIKDATLDPRPLFHGPPYSIKEGNSSFPSGHTTAAFAAATVYAQEYRDRPLVPIISYTVATLIGLSRTTENKHWISDVFAGAALGYVTGLQVVRNYHRYAYLQNHKANKNSVSFGLQFNYDHVEPGITYSFR